VIRSFAAWALAAFLLGACAGPGGESFGPTQTRCDDGGDGGVLIDGICL
jgi:hypothetical protein